KILKVLVFLEIRVLELLTDQRKSIDRASGDIRGELDRLNRRYLAEAHFVWRNFVVLACCIAAVVRRSEIFTRLRPFWRRLISAGRRRIGGGRRFWWGWRVQIRQYLRLILAGLLRRGWCRRERLGKNQSGDTDHRGISDPAPKCKNQKPRREEGCR